MIASQTPGYWRFGCTLLTVWSICVFICTGSAAAQTWTWNGGAGAPGNWNAAGNWTPPPAAAVPASANSTAIVMSTAVTTATVQNIADPFLLNSLTYSPTAGSFTIGPPGGATGTLQFEPNNTVNPATPPQIINNSGPGAGQDINVPIKIDNTTLTLGGTSGNQVDLNGVISNGPNGAGAIVIQSGTGGYALGSPGVNNLYTGNTTLQSGELVIDSNQALGPAGNGKLILAGGTIRSAQDAAYTVGNVVNLTGNTTFGDASTTNILTFSAQAVLMGNLTLTANNAITNFQGGISDGGNNFNVNWLGNATSLKNPDGTRSLVGGIIKTGLNTKIGGNYTIGKGGAVIVGANTLTIVGQTVTINAGGFFGGNGSKALGKAKLQATFVDFKKQGTFICPKDGSLDVSGDVEFESGSIFAEDIEGTDPGDGYTQLNVTDGPGQIDPGAILDINSGIPLTYGETFEIMTRDAPPPTGDNMFSDLNGNPLPEDSTFYEGGYQFMINYGADGLGDDTGGYDVQLTVVPEPVGGTMFIAAIAVSALSRRRTKPIAKN